MGQYPPPYESDPYPTSAQGAGPTPSPYGIGPARPGTPPYGGAPPYAPAPVFVVPPPTPEQVAEKSLRTARGLGLGAAITGVVSVVFQGLALLSAVLIPSNADDWSAEGVVVWLMAAFMSIMIGPLLILLTWATSFGLALAACISANTRRSTPTPAQWAGIAGDAADARPPRGQRRRPAGVRHYARRQGQSEARGPDHYDDQGHEHDAQ